MPVNEPFGSNPSALVNDPYPIYRLLRENSPVSYVDSFDSYVVALYRDCTNILKDINYGKKAINYYNSNDLEMQFLAENSDKYPHIEQNSILTLNPPDHTRLRSLVSRAFTPRVIESLRPFVRSITSSIIETNNGRPFDVISTIAAPVPAYVIAKMMGVPDRDKDKFKQMSDDMILALDPTKGREELMKSIRAQYELALYFDRLIQLKANEPGDDLTSSLIKVEDTGSKLTHSELLTMCILLLSAGHETTTNLIGNGFYTLLNHREQMEILKNDRSTLKNGIEEMLRFESPVQLTSRIAPENVIIEGVEIERGQRIITLLGSANRDPEANEDPDSFNVERKNVKHLSFSEGIHFCLGAPLARMEAEVVFDLLLDRFPKARIAGEPKWKENITMRGLESLVIKP